MFRNLESFIGKTILKIDDKPTAGDEYLIFHFSDGEEIIFGHQQDCCESVWLEDVEGDWETLIGNPLLVAEVNSNGEWDEGDYEHKTWTFYKFATIKGHVDLRFCGASNGYYSESVDIYSREDKLW